MEGGLLLETSKVAGSSGFDKRHRRKQPLHAHALPFGSILMGQMGSADMLRRSGHLKPPISFEWLPGAGKTVNNIKHLLCGAISAIFSKSVTAPLERTKMEMQIHRSSRALGVVQKMVKEGGYLSLWQGNMMNLIRVAPHKAVNFYSFYLYRTTLSKALASSQTSLGGLDRFAAGALADVIRTRMLSGNKKYASAGATIRHMLGEESVAGFYVGCLPAVLSTAASGAIFYGVYDILKTRYVSSEQRKLQASKGVSDEVIMGAGRTMLYGALAGAAAESILYPLEVLRRRMQLQGIGAREVLSHMKNADHGALTAAGKASVKEARRVATATLRRNYLGKVLSASSDIYKIDGLSGFYNGIAPHILQVLPSAALSYYFYEACKQALQVEEES